MRNIFAPRLFKSLSFPERLLHVFVTIGIPTMIFDYIKIDGPEEGWIAGLPLAIFGGIVIAIVGAILEHVFIKGVRGKRKPKEPLT